MHPDFSHWGVLVGTHILRSFWDDWGQQALKGEITTLRVEVHRAKELVADYNYVLETCERDSKSLRNSAHLGATINVILGLICATIWVINYLRKRSRAVAAVEDGCPDEENSPPVVPRRVGPVRPSQLHRSR